MAFATAKDLASLKTSNTFQPVINGYRYGNLAPALLTQTTARAVLKECLQACLEHRQGNKINRPWNIVDVTKNLDPEQAWYGFEFESGYQSDADYRRVINYFWSRFPYSAIDTEGFGQFSAELTFSPCNEADLDDNSFGLMKLVRFLNRNKIKMLEWSPTHEIGTHVNISTPKFRTLSPLVAGRVAEQMTMLISSISYEEKVEFFGREPYGYCYFRNPKEGKQWIEFKLFNSTQSEAAVKGYAKLAKRLARMMDVLSDESSFYTVEEERAMRIAVQAYWDEDPLTRGAYMLSALGGTGNTATFLRGDSEDVPRPVHVSIPEQMYYTSTERKNSAAAAATAAALRGLQAFRDQQATTNQ